MRAPPGTGVRRAPDKLTGWGGCEVDLGPGRCRLTRALARRHTQAALPQPADPRPGTPTSHLHSRRPGREAGANGLAGGGAEQPQRPLPLLKSWRFRPAAAPAPSCACSGPGRAGAPLRVLGGTQPGSGTGEQGRGVEGRRSSGDRKASAPGAGHAEGGACPVSAPLSNPSRRAAQISAPPGQGAPARPLRLPAAPETKHPQAWSLMFRTTCGLNKRAFRRLGKPPRRALSAQPWGLGGDARRSPVPSSRGWSHSPPGGPQQSIHREGGEQLFPRAEATLGFKLLC